jgi:excisionase family DNA binding protein
MGEQTVELFQRNFLRPSEVADYLRLSDETIANLVNRGELPSIRVDSDVLIPSPALRAYIRRASKRAGDG